MGMSLRFFPQVVLSQAQGSLEFRIGAGHRESSREISLVLPEEWQRDFQGREGVRKTPRFSFSSSLFFPFYCTQAVVFHRHFKLLSSARDYRGQTPWLLLGVCGLLSVFGPGQGCSAGNMQQTGVSKALVF